MTIQPLAPAERPSNADPAEPLPDEWCYRCWGRACRDPRTAWHDPARPETLAVTAERIALRTLLDGEIPVRVNEWTVGHVALVQAVAKELQDISAAVEARGRKLAQLAE